MAKAVTQGISVLAFEAARKYSADWRAPAVALAGVNAAVWIGVMANLGGWIILFLLIGAFFGAMLAIWLAGDEKWGALGAVATPLIYATSAGWLGGWGVLIFNLAAGALIYWIWQRRLEMAAVMQQYGYAQQEQVGPAGQQQIGLPAGAEYIARHDPDPDAFRAIIGLEEAKQALVDALELPLTQPELISEYKIKPPKGILLYGPPGTGKTSFARAAANCYGCSFYVTNASGLTGGIVGTTEENIRRLFSHAKCNRPAVIFFDEIDAIGRKREGQHYNRPSDLALNVLLAEMDGFDQTEGVVCIAATNRLDVLDEALVRPGRFDRKIEVGLPDGPARKEMLAKFLAGRPHAVTEEELGQLAAAATGKSPADLLGMVDRAAIEAARTRRKITANDLSAALAQAAPKRQERRPSLWLPPTK